MPCSPQAKSKDKHGALDPYAELTMTSPYVYYRVDSYTFTMGNPMPESTLTLCQSLLYPPVRDFAFALRLFIFFYIASAGYTMEHF